jgi:hypothetical protein
MTSVGLHLTKCAGTSLMSSVRRHLTEDEYILISSYYENILASRAQAWDIADYSRILLVFGHYIHESLFQLLRPKTIWDIFLFTGVRMPSSRTVSQYYQLVKVTDSYPEIEGFVSSYGSSMCDEILRAFPSMVSDDKPKWLSAAEILTAFDYIYSTENYYATIGPIYQSLGLSTADLENTQVADNVRSIELDPDIVAQITEELAISDDVRLYSLIAPAIGKKNAGKLIADELGIDRKREQAFSMAFTQTQSDYDFARDYDLLGYELHLLGKSKKKEAIQILEQRKNRLNELLDFLKTRDY